jgi:uncharacterized repeat protein (TIGR01451 family)
MERKLKKSINKSFFIAILFILSTVNIVSLTATVRADDNFYVVGEKTRYVFAESTANFTIEGRAWDTDVWISEVTVNGDNINKYEPLNDNVYFKIKKYSNSQYEKVQIYNFKTSEKHGFYKGGPNGNLWKRFKLCVEIPTDAEQWSEIEIKIKKGDHPIGSLWSTLNIIVNNGIWEKNGYPGTIVKFNMLQDDFERPVVVYSNSNNELKTDNRDPWHPNEDWLGGSKMPYDPWDTYYIWFGDCYYMTYPASAVGWTYNDGPLYIYIPLNAKFGDNLKIKLLGKNSDYWAYVNIKETHEPIVGQHVTKLFDGPRASHTVKLISYDPMNEVQAGETAVFKFTYRGGCQLKPTWWYHPPTSFDWGTNYPKGGQRLSSSVYEDNKLKIRATFPGYFLEDNEVMTVYITPKKTLSCGENLKILIGGIVSSTGIKPHNMGQVYNLINLKVTKTQCPDIEIQKMVKNPQTQTWVENIDAQIDDYVRFKIGVHNSGPCCDLTNIVIEDRLPSGLEYVPDTATIPPTVNGNNLKWELAEPISPNNWEYIEFSTRVTACGMEKVNTASVSGYCEITDETLTDSDTASVDVKCPEEPCIEYTPHEYDFGCMQECESDTTTFEIWNGCAGTLEYDFSWDCGWVTSVTPTSGSSTGEADTITVEINTAGLDFGDYSCDIHISSNGGDGIFTVNVTVGNCYEPCLEYSPESHAFGEMPEGVVDFATFDIWNGCSGTLEFALFEGCSWLSILSPTSGNSTGEHDNIAIEIDTTDLSEGEHSCVIDIESNGGDGAFTVQVTVEDDPNPNQAPSVKILNPLDKTLNFRNLSIRFPITLVIGSIDIEAEAADADGDIVKLEFYVDGELRKTINSETYIWTWDETAIGFHNISIKAYDDDGSIDEASLDLIMFNFGII